MNQVTDKPSTDKPKIDLPSLPQAPAEEPAQAPGKETIPSEPVEVGQLTEQQADRLHEALQPQDAPTPASSSKLGAKEEQINKEQSEKGSDAPGG